MSKHGIGNIIEEGVELPENVTLGNYNIIRKGVRFEILSPSGQLTIGDCNVFNENVKILIGSNGVSIGDWNVFHNQILLTGIGNTATTIGHNCWFGQNCILDGSGGLTIGNGVRVGMYSQIWSHVASGEQLEGCLLYGYGHTIIENDVWLVGSCIIASGVTLGEKSICMTTSFVQKNTEQGATYIGNPAQKMEKLKLWYKPKLKDKFEMMVNWSKEFTNANADVELIVNGDQIILKGQSNEQIIIGNQEHSPALTPTTTYFNLVTKTYTKRLTSLERRFYKFIYNNKARFLPQIDSK
ncbi:Acetyltransferase (isoleucine patch superfamily) [Chitinophaga jiangningensis]|uniref:Acetyltransferase (Isoleucine patch superfamily) n=1 Tax=Chitinophaga jiangningensis TaxID=1419482 RepID=A0A1M7HIK9_9BACT|nr:hypothetical protein [Chitinophaga jiangningensis]SHM28310.1 Acetyltransferase (isoleucine patch superfamily) [Chitinophaga jiangningensis]